ncbi:MAG: DNA polymerase III subunit gamma/tau [Patescibacteria group bacterium]|jgi:DNA polymerase-3 subunit gamma/tau
MAHEAVYRKYRPAVFADVTGQDFIKNTIQNEIKLGRIAHAYLFSGPRGIGKTTLARLLAKAVNCSDRKEGEYEPCNACQHCVDFQAGRALDVIEIDAATNTGVDSVRENIIEAVRFAPTAGKYKVFIIDEVHMLSTSSFNALLKTLEEPPAHAIFILATTEMHKIPETILSRCQRFDFHRIGPVEMIARMKEILSKEEVEVDDEVLHAIARASEGAMRDAESLLGQVLALGEKKITKEMGALVIPMGCIESASRTIEALGNRDAKGAVEELHAFTSQGGVPGHLLDEVVEFCRMTLFELIGAPHEDRYPEATMTQIRGLTKKMNESACLKLLDLLLQAKARPATDPFPELPLEIAFVLFCAAEAPVQKIVVQEAPKQAVQVAQPAPVIEQEEDLVFDMEPNPALLKTIPIQKGMPEKKAELVMTPDRKAEFTLEEIQGKWGRCCEAVGSRNIALPMALNESKPEKFDEAGKLCIRFAREFHFETMNKPGNLKILTESIAEVMQSPVVLTLVYSKPPEENMDELAQAFGGKVV